MELSQIRYFIVAAQYQNLSKAARVLNITQPALSKSISKLEDELGGALFERSGKRISLNECGEDFLEHAVHSMQELDGAVAIAKNRVSRSALHLGLFLQSGSMLQCISEFSQANPGVSFFLEMLNVSTHSFDTNEFDMLLYPQSPSFRKYKGRMLYSEPFFLAVHKTNRLAHKESVALADVSGENVVFFRHGKKLLDLPYHLCASLGVRVGDGMFTNSYEVQRWLISNNSGVGFVPHGRADAYAADPDIVLLPVAEEGLSQDVMVGFKRDKHLSSDGRRFSAFVREYYRDMHTTTAE